MTEPHADRLQSTLTETPAAPASADRDALFERIVLANDQLRVEIIPALCKISSLQTVPEGHELLQQPLRPYAPRTATMPFDQGDASGWDECLPAVSQCEVATAAGTVTVPDHGDFWRVPAEASLKGNEVTLEADGISLPLHFGRTLRLEGQRLTVDYRVRNTSVYDVPFAWSAHPLFTIEAGDRVVLPQGQHKLQVEGSGHNRLGPAGSTHVWPLAALGDGGTTDLSIAGEISDDIGDKLYTAAPAEGWCAIDRVRLGRRITVNFDPEALPWLGLWLCYGGWPEGASARQYAVALEPCTAPVDSLAAAMAKGWARTLPPQGSAQWSIQIDVTVVS